MLTTAQKTTLKAYILAQPDLAPLVSGATTDRAACVNALNADAAPVTAAWRSSVAPADLDESADYTVFDTIVAGKRDSWGYMIAFNRDFNRSKIRKWVTDIWGNATASSVAAGILNACTENASRAEVALGGTTATTGTVSALKRSWEGEISIQDIAEMFNV